MWVRACLFGAIGEEMALIYEWSYLVRLEKKRIDWGKGDPSNGAELDGDYLCWVERAAGSFHPRLIGPIPFLETSGKWHRPPPCKRTLD